MEYETVWNGRDAVTDSLERDYAECRGEGWDLIWQPTSPLTTPWGDLAHLAGRDPNVHLRHARRSRRQSKSARFDGTSDIDAVLDALLGKIRVLPDEIDEVRQELAIGLLTKKLPLAATSEEISRYRAKARRGGTNWFQHLSIAAKARNDEGSQTWGQRLGLT